ncbi:hypothetical protein ABZ669_14670 [Streptomyces hirsutus]|uniref:hypothetical protein n=1 Tax=Streptomyces hirsutus TaxID=35620 RepID=UPI0034053522
MTHVKASAPIAAIALATDTARERGIQAACPDGVAWCTGAPDAHDDPREHRHESRMYALTGRYLQDPDRHSVGAVYLSAWDDDAPRLVFQGTGLWPSLSLPEADELIGDAVTWTVGLISTRRRFAIELNPGKGPFTESEEQQTAAAAFSLATRAMDIALEKTGDRAGMLLALRTVLDMAEAEG